MTLSTTVATQLVHWFFGTFSANGQRTQKIFERGKTFAILVINDKRLHEGKSEIVESEAVKKAIGKKTVELYKSYLQSQIRA